MLGESVVRRAERFKMSWLIWLVRISGLVFVAFFVLASRLPRNRFAGIRVSYALADEDVWRKLHMRFRWPVLCLGLLCLLYPIANFQDFVTFTYILVGLLIVIPIASYLYARRLYVEKYRTAKVVSHGFFKYEPPNTQATHQEDHRT
jgi:uncharacterized membrane protein